MTALLRIIELVLQWACYFMVGVTGMLGLFLAGWIIREHCEERAQREEG